MERSGSPLLLFENLDLTPLHSILWKSLHQKGAGPPVEYDPECDLRALMLRQLEQIPYVKDLSKRLSRNPQMRRACGYEHKTPTEAHFSQMKKRIGAEGFQAIEAYLRHEPLKIRNSQPLSAVGLIQAACMDSTDFQAWSSQTPHTLGPREGTRRNQDPHNISGVGDPDAKVGRTNKGFILGYQSIFAPFTQKLGVRFLAWHINEVEETLNLKNLGRSGMMHVSLIISKLSLIGVEENPFGRLLPMTSLVT